MHFIVVAIILFALIYLILKANSQPDTPADTEFGSTSPAYDAVRFAYISNGKLFLHNTATSDTTPIESPYVQEAINRVEKKSNLHGWKKNTSLETSFVGRAQQAGDQVAIQMKTARFLDDNRLIYFQSDDHVGGLFEYGLDTAEEKRLLHQQKLHYDNIAIHPDNQKILGSRLYDNGTSNIEMMGSHGEDPVELTEGDSIDSFPSWIPTDDRKILYQSCGIARDSDGYIAAVGPTSLELLDLDDQSVVTVREQDGSDFLQPRVDSQGNLYFIRRPYEASQYNSTTFFMDFILFPFRLLRAVFHYLNFFSLMYSRKPLTSASGPEFQRDIKDILIKGRRIDAEKTLRKGIKLNGIPTLVPASWQLVRRTKQGEETVLARHVAAFDISSKDEILFSTGFAVYILKDNGKAAVVLRDKLISEVVAS